MERDPHLFLEDIIYSIDLIEQYLRNQSKQKFFDDTKLQDCIARRLEIIGEASKRLPVEIREKNSEISWNKITGTRDILAHAYFGTNLEIIWNVIENKLPTLKKQVKEILDNLK